MWSSHQQQQLKLLLVFYLIVLVYLVTIFCFVSFYHTRENDYCVSFLDRGRAMAFFDVLFDGIIYAE